MWSVGCIVAEMVEVWCSPFESESGTQFMTLMMIFRLLGTPDETVWPGVTTLPNFNALFPSWPRRPTQLELEKLGYAVEPVGQTAVSAFLFAEEDLSSFPNSHRLFRRMMRLNPEHRSTAWEALQCV